MFCEVTVAQPVGLSVFQVVVQPVVVACAVLNEVVVLAFVPYVVVVACEVPQTVVVAAEVPCEVKRDAGVDVAQEVEVRREAGADVRVWIAVPCEVTQLVYQAVLQLVVVFCPVVTPV